MKIERNVSFLEGDMSDECTSVNNHLFSITDVLGMKRWY